MSDGRWLDHATSAPEVELRAGLDEARARTLDEVALQRLWGRIANPELRRPARPRWTWFAGGVVSSAALALTLAFVFWPGRSHFFKHDGASAAPRTMASAAPAVAPAPPQPSVGDRAGAAAVAERTADDAAPAHPEHAAHPLAARRVMASGVVHTGRSEVLPVVLPGGAEARLAASSALSLEPQGKGAAARPRVERGEVMFTVPRQPPGQTFAVLAGPYRIVVVGTRFRVRVDGPAVGVNVLEGVVEVWNGQRLARLVPGDAWSSPAERPARGAVAERGTGGGRSAAADAVAVPVRVARAAPDEGPARPEAPAALGGGAASVQDPRVALEAGEPRRALEAYRAIAARGGSAAENAEYEIGRVLRDRLNDPDGAITAWRRYRSQHPDGLLRIETDVSIIETLVSAGDPVGALAEANDFLRRHPDSERRAEIARVAGDLYRSRGDCTRALGAYQTALSAPRNKDVADYASFHRASCMVSLEQSSARDALESYQRSFPNGRFRSEASRLLRRLDERTGAP